MAGALAGFTLADALLGIETEALVAIQAAEQTARFTLADALLGIETFLLPTGRIFCPMVSLWLMPF